MHQLLQDYFDKNNIETLKNKNELLIKLGLYEKEYSDKNEYSKEYPFPEYGGQDVKYEHGENTKYYKKVPIDVTDEEYSKIIQCEKKKTKAESKISNIFKVLAVLIFVGGFISGIALGRVPDELFTSHYEFSFTLALMYWLISFVTGMLFLGFAEIIQLLTDIKNK